MTVCDSTIAEWQYDVSSGIPFQFGVSPQTKSLLFRFDPDPNGSLANTVFVYLYSVTPGRAWAILRAGQPPVSRPAPDCQAGVVMTLVPQSGARGIVTITMSSDVQGVQ